MQDLPPVHENLTTSLTRDFFKGGFRVSKTKPTKIKYYHKQSWNKAQTSSKKKLWKSVAKCKLLLAAEKSNETNANQERDDIYGKSCDTTFNLF